MAALDAGTALGGAGTGGGTTIDGSGGGAASIWGREQEAAAQNAAIRIRVELDTDTA